MKKILSKFPVVVWKHLPVAGLAILPFIFVNRQKYKSDLVMINHERIHLQQQIELLWLPFMIIYLINYALNLFRYKTKDEAYRNIIFEREAFAMDHQVDYLERRKLFGFLRFVQPESIS